METASRGTRSIRFDVFEVDLAARELIRRNRRVRLQELPFRLLEALLERPGETVMREELRNRLWGEAAVEFDDGLHTAVRKLREVLGDSATRPRFVETVPRRGYRFIAPVSVSVETADAAPEEIAGNIPPPRGPSVYPWGIATVVAVLIVVIAVMPRSAKKEYRAYADFGEAVPIAAERGTERSPALSPDGARVVFSWSGEAGGNPNLYVQNIDGTGRVRLTVDQAPDRFPSWSPDGKTIAFVREGKVFSMPAIGGPQRRITTASDDGVSWSPDSRTLAVSDQEASEGSSSLYLVSVETGKRRRLTFPALSKQQDIWPAFIPQGDSVAFVRRTTTTDDIYRVSLGGGSPTRLAISGRPLQGLAWTPGGSFVLAATGRQAPGLFVIPAGARDQTQMQRLDMAGTDVYEPSVVARNGGRAMDLAFGHETSNWDIWGIPLKGLHAAPTPLIASIRNDQAPSFSPDGKWLAFNSARGAMKRSGLRARTVPNRANSPTLIRVWRVRPAGRPTGSGSYSTPPSTATGTFM